MLTHKLLSFVGKVLARNKLNILIYHQVFAEKNAMRPSEPDADTFTWQMQLLKNYFTPLSVSSAIKHIKNNSLPANAICVTFDDGYVNNLEVAAPILKQFNIPATVFVATGFSDGENMFNDRIIDLVADKKLQQLNQKALNEPSVVLSTVEQRIELAQKILSKIKYLPILERKTLIDDLYAANNVTELPAKMMSSEQLITLHNMGIEIGAHTVDHPILKILDPKSQKEQIDKGKEKLENLLGVKVRGFAYPNGKIDTDYNNVTRNIVEDLAFDYAVSTNWGCNTNATDSYQLYRFTPWDNNPVKFHLRLILNAAKN